MAPMERLSQKWPSYLMQIQQELEGLCLLPCISQGTAFPEEEAEAVPEDRTLLPGSPTWSQLSDVLHPKQNFLNYVLWQ